MRDMDSTSPDNDHESLTTEASKLFLCKEYDQCSLLMRKLIYKRPNDAKVIMNKALLDYAHDSKFTRTNEYICELKRAAEIEGFVLDDKVQTDEHSNSVTQDTTQTEESHSSASQSTNSTLSKPLVLRSSSAICLLYNYSLILFYQRQYIQAERFLSRCLGIEIRKDSPNRTPNKPTTAFRLEHPIVDYNSYFLLPVIDLTPSPDVNLCRRILLLWLEVLLKISMADCVFDLCEAWLMCISSSSVAAAIKVQTQTSPEHQTNTSFRHISTQALDVLTGVRRPLQLFYIRACLLTGRLKSAELELNMILTEEKSDHLSSYKPQNSTNSEIELPPDNNHDKSKESNTQPSSCDQGNLNSSSETFWNTGQSVQFLQAQLAFLQNQHSQALQNLSSLSSSPRISTHLGQSETTLIWNNLGLVHHRSGQFNMGSVQLRRAVRETSTVLHDLLPSNMTMQSDRNSDNTKQLLDKVPIQLFSLSQHHALLYNYGLNLLFASRPSSAFVMFIQLIETYPRNPRLWFRLAECCIKLHSPNNLTPWKLDKKMQYSVEVIGSGPCRKILLADTPKAVLPTTQTEMPSSSKPDLKFALVALRNALILLPHPPDKLLTHEMSTSQRRTVLLKWANKQNVLTLPNPSPLRGPGLLHLLSATYLNLAYVALCLDHPVETLRTASQLIIPSSGSVLTTESNTENQSGNNSSTTQPSSQRPLASLNEQGLALVAPSTYTYLARLYYTEALILMDRSDEALDQLRSYISYSESGTLSFSSVLQALGGVSFRPVHLLPWSRNSSPTELTNPNIYPVSGKIKISNGDFPGVSVVRPSDFPSNATQATSLLLYNLAVTLAIQKMYNSAEYCLDLSLPGLLLSTQQLDGRKWSHQSNSLSSVATPTSPKILPSPAILLRLFLELSQGRTKRTAIIMHEFFGNFSLTGRINPLPMKSDLSSDNGSLLTDLNDVQYFLKSQQLQLGSATNSRLASSVLLSSSLTTTTATATTTTANTLTTNSNSQIQKRPANLWAPNQQLKQLLTQPTQQQQQMYLSSMFQTQTPTQTSLSNQQYVNRWDQSVQPSSTSLVNSTTNETDWPTL